ncbi:MAG: transglutaminase domain-containing protein [Candidatus Hydrogenedentes bacterium]|nr:transglutaminase domain-containing protein [Candidatus Hydrogenedentota bacterium]
MAVGYNFHWRKHDHVRMSARSLGRDISLFSVQRPWTPPTVNVEGKVTYYDPGRIAAVRKRLKGVKKEAYLAGVLDRILGDATTDRERVASICGFVSDALYYNPIQQPQENHTGKLVLGAVELLELHDGRCGQGVVVTLALLKAAGIKCRKRDVFHHVTCEAWYDGDWHLADALMFGENQPEWNGAVVNVEYLQRHPYFADAFPLWCFAYTPEELLSADGYRLLGYCFGEWGTLPYYSWYMGGVEEYPPTLPTVLPPQRISDTVVRLRWTPSAKRNGGHVRYRVRVYSDRDRRNVFYDRQTPQTVLPWRVPETNRMYFIGVTAFDDHIRKNQRTWYPEAVGNFVLVPKEQYGWYGVL